MTNGVDEMLNSVRKEINLLGTDGSSAVMGNLEKMIKTQMNTNPYQTLATALSIGVGIGALNKHHFKHAAVRVGKLLAMHALSDLENCQGKLETKNAS